MGDADQPGLQGRAECGAAEVDGEESDQQAGQGAGGGQEQAHQGGDVEREAHQQSPAQGAVGGDPAQDVAERHPEPGGGQHPRHHARGGAGDLGGDVGDVAEHREPAREADRGDAHDDPQLQAAQGHHLVDGPSAHDHRLGRERGAQCEHREHEDPGDHEVDGAPSDQLAEGGHQRHADEVRDREPGQGDGHSLALAAGAHQRSGQQRGDPEVGAVRDSGEEAGEDGELEAGHRGGEHGAGRERRGQRDDHRGAAPAHREQGEHGRAHDDAEGVGGDQLPGAGDAGVGGGGHLLGQQAVGDAGQQAHGGELGGADAHAAQGEGEQGEGAAAGADLVRCGGWGHEGSSAVGKQGRRGVIDRGTE